MPLPLYLYSAKTLQNWTPETPWKTGIGGSETAHIEMHGHLLSKFPDIRSFAPLPDNIRKTKFPGWENSTKLPTTKPALIINYRDYALYDQKFAPGTKHWFVAQDVDYPWTFERLAKIDRYITLCTDHSKFTLHKYPQLKGCVFQSSNGVRGEYINDLWAKNSIERNPKQIIYASSPDRGLKLLLEQWYRIIERVPDAELKIAYGFENTNKIIELMGGESAYHQGFRDSITRLMKQPGVTWLGRLTQGELYEEWFKSNIWAYPNSFAETSCITCMDAQACGTIPITNNLWAVGENVSKTAVGKVFPAQPQDDILVRTYFIEQIINSLKYPIGNAPRYKHAKNAIAKFDWKVIADQWKNWIEKDIEHGF